MRRMAAYSIARSVAYLHVAYPDWLQSVGDAQT
jgi:hypothetical protein